MQPLVADRLAAHDGEYFLYAQYAQLPCRETTFADHRAAVLAEMTRRLGARAQTLQTPPDPQLVTLKSWQFGFTDAADLDAAARSARDFAYLKLQGHRGDHLTSAWWRDYLAAQGRPDLWIARGREREGDGWLLEANACFAAARWIDPTCEPELAAITAARDPNLPRRLRDQPAADYPGLRFADRHWRAWDMKNYGRLDLPSLLRWACDRNFSVRTRIYRSLGQRPHPAAILTLREGTHDPHPFARAQAVRSLGWCADPTGVDALRRLAAEDPHPEVRRAAAWAVDRIVGFWTFYGEWNAISADPARVLATAQQLADLGLRRFAWEVLVNYGDAGSDAHPAIDALAEALEPDTQLPGFSDPDEYSYSHWFAAAREVEAAGDPNMSPETAAARAHAPGPDGFEARRLLRSRGLPIPPAP